MTTRGPLHSPIHPILLVVTLWAVPALPACPPSTVPEDASLDVAMRDAPRSDATFDALRCNLSCATTQERCCRAPEGVEQCIDVSADVTNCGVCGLDCVATRRGDRCIAMQCSCGDFSIGCTGEDNSSCCPVAPDGRAQRCANLGRDFGDCGDCGRTCDIRQANRCEGGLCRCGVAGDLCAGTETDLCCVDVFGVAACVDTGRDSDHCGRCNRRCGAFENCIDGECVDFTRQDAGSLDAGPLDAGPLDAGSHDSGSEAPTSLDAAPGADAGT
ncbi:MAG: hypothetical protein ACK5U8_01260 [Deltaproteobacteria bacterium]